LKLLWIKLIHHLNPKSEAPAFAEAASRRQANIQIISNNQYPNLFGDLNLVIEYYLGFVIWNL